ncbi:hypothetical protein [Brevundimonas sp. Root1423]|uniref:hypothetical protein n=1 Tax=Brevundimonas sp. Root1423 TaxID=1736462 RepID=UPI0006F96DAC|nr:hypothetical protein [Brevundimonas sp. Root1423]KQY75350.1 hypothetical protein ASD25_12510 [Brevundimonas sp. Root1423]
MAQAELNSLIVSNLKDLEAVTRHLEDTLQPLVGEAIDEVVERHLTKTHWEGETAWDDDGSWLAPKAWRKPDGSSGDEFFCQFSLEADSDLEGAKDGYWLSQLLGLGHAKLGFRWVRNDVGKLRWRKAVGANTALIADLRGLGFSYDEKSGSFFLPVIVEPSAMSDALVQETPQLALQPLHDALDTLVRSQAKFDELRQATADVE